LTAELKSSQYTPSTHHIHDKGLKRYNVLSPNPGSPQSGRPASPGDPFAALHPAVAGVMGSPGQQHRRRLNGDSPTASPTDSESPSYTPRQQQAAAGAFNSSPLGRPTGNGNGSAYAAAAAASPGRPTARQLEMLHPAFAGLMSPSGGHEHPPPPPLAAAAAAPVTSMQPVTTMQQAPVPHPAAPRTDSRAREAAALAAASWPHAMLHPAVAGLMSPSGSPQRQQQQQQQQQRSGAQSPVHPTMVQSPTSSAQSPRPAAASPKPGLRSPVHPLATGSPNGNGGNSGSPLRPALRKTSSIGTRLGDAPGDAPGDAQPSISRSSSRRSIKFADEEDLITPVEAVVGPAGADVSNSGSNNSGSGSGSNNGGAARSSSGESSASSPELRTAATVAPAHPSAAVLRQATAVHPALAASPPKAVPHPAAPAAPRAAAAHPALPQAAAAPNGTSPALTHPADATGDVPDAEELSQLLISCGFAALGPSPLNQPSGSSTAPAAAAAGDGDVAVRRALAAVLVQYRQRAALLSQLLAERREAQRGVAREVGDSARAEAERDAAVREAERAKVRGDARPRRRGAMVFAAFWSPVEKTDWLHHDRTIITHKRLYKTHTPLSPHPIITTTTG